MSRTIVRRLERLEAAQRPAERQMIVISDLGEGHRFFAEHARFMTKAEMDAVEADLFATGKARPGDTVYRIVHVIVDRPGREIPLDRMQ
jgi:hypothetical protein